MRTHEAGALRGEHAGSPVTLAGWVARRRDHGGVAFVDLRDASGVVQAVVRDERLLARVAHGLRPESCVRLVGEVALRPPGNENADIPTGDVEVVVHEADVLAEAAPLPFQVDEHVEVGEDVRLRYRYLDLRREGPARAIRLRSRVTHLIREVMDGLGFVDVETPYLTRSTPEGARDFLVPVRLQPGTWYALPQSPQLFKQLLMVAGLERYYQIARCFRDEDLRADRQPEFTQLDVEMSFVDQDDVVAVAESVLRRVWGEIAGFDLPDPLPRMTYADAMARYGSDKPDLRFGCELVDLTDFFSATPFQVFQAPYVGAVVMPGGASQSRRELDGWQEWARSRGAKGLAYVLVQEDGTLGGPVARNLAEFERAGLTAAVGASPGDCVFFAAGRPGEARAVLGAARLEVGRRCGLIDDGAWAFTWVIDAPMFEEDGEGGWTAVHHPFTSPTAEWVEGFADDPEHALAYAYDVVVNGMEIGGGSIRIHRAEMQSQVFDVIGLSKAQAEEKFGFLLEAFRYGPPPHGGIAFGLDRMCALLAGTDSIREVIAFPKTASGADPLTGAPTPITPVQRRDAGVDARPQPAQPGAPIPVAPPPNRPGGEVRPDTSRS